ncbi:MAG: hypothetical protein MI702_01455, partial [Chlorobiales bacterium]|nr:hypothetical protein [Chlorobiales bacterium]
MKRLLIGLIVLTVVWCAVAMSVRRFPGHGNPTTIGIAQAAISQHFRDACAGSVEFGDLDIGTLGWTTI